MKFRCINSLIALMIILVASCSVEEPRGEVWVRGRAVTSSFELHKDGTYVSKENCDICPEREVRGVWRRDAKTLVLSARSGAPDQVLVELDYRGCHGYVPVEQSFKTDKLFPTDIYFRWRDECARHL